MARGMALESIKIGKLGIEDLDQAPYPGNHNRKQDQSPKDLLRQWLFTKIHFFLDTFSQYSYIVITF